MKKIILDIAKVIGAVATIAGAALWFDARFDKSAEDLKEIKQTVDYINVEQSWMAEDLESIHDTLARIERMQVRQSERQKSIVWILRNQEDFTPDQLRDIMDEMLKKNNGQTGSVSTPTSTTSPAEWQGRQPERRRKLLLNALTRR